MIFVLHGDDLASSYIRLQELLNKVSNYQKIRLSAKSSDEELYLALFGSTVLSVPKIIILENYLTSSKKIDINLWRQIPQDLTIIFHENKALTSGKLAPFTKTAKIELFKQRAEIFQFLDGLSPYVKNSLKLLVKLSENDRGFIWQIQQRLLLIILSKLGISLEAAANLTKRNIFDWQWQRISLQAGEFNLENLLALYNATIKVDYLIKKGRTSLNESTLLSILLLKYLPQ